MHWRQKNHLQYQHTQAGNHCCSTILYPDVTWTETYDAEMGIYKQGRSGLTRVSKEGETTCGDGWTQTEVSQFLATTFAHFSSRSFRFQRQCVNPRERIDSCADRKWFPITTPRRLNPLLVRTWGLQLAEVRDETNSLKMAVFWLLRRIVW